MKDKVLCKSDALSCALGFSRVDCPVRSGDSSFRRQDTYLQAMPVLARADYFVFILNTTPYPSVPPLDAVP
jgi:hypothetical protein